MKENDNQKLQQLLKQYLPPVAGNLSHDLWPKMIDRLNENPLPRTLWLDWALLGLLMLVLMVVPEIIPILLYQL